MALNDGVRHNVSLKAFNTFGLDVSAASFSEFVTIEELIPLLEFNSKEKLPLLILGGGSNILFTKNYEGFVIKNNIPGIEITDASGNDVLVTVGSGVRWHDFVLWAVNNNYGGVENLSLIPGSVGAAPIQNIGAYGVELKDSFEYLDAIEINSGKLMRFDKMKCNFGYRDSYFKREGKGNFIITSVTFKLKKNPEFKLSYGAIQNELSKMDISEPTVKAVSDAVCNIRRSKLPDPAVLGNAGSFFKNPEVEKILFDELKNEYPDIVGYPVGENAVKLAAGWLIEKCGWKGKKVGNTGSHKDQALVLVNYGGAVGGEVVKLSNEIRESVKQKFNVDIEPEVNII